MKNVYEIRNREIKLTKLLCGVPLAVSLEEREQLALVLERANVPSRNAFAERCSVNAPSDLTWRELCAAVRARPLATVDQVRAQRSA